MHRPERDLVKAIKDYLKILENLGQIVHFDRLNSGKIPMGRGPNKRLIVCCREGTPDLFVVLKTGAIIWIEAKSDKGVLSHHQVRFRNKFSRVPGHLWLEIRSMDQLMDQLARLGVLK